MSSKITVIGAGSVGSTIAYTLSNQNVASEIVLIDINKEKVEGEVMDIAQGNATILIHQSHLQNWGIQTEELFQMSCII